jgi:transposase
VLYAEPLGQPEVVTGAYAASVRSLVAVLRVLDQQIATLQSQVVAQFGRHPDAEILASQPGLGQILGARVLAEFGDDPTRYATAKAGKHYAGTRPTPAARARPSSSPPATSTTTG